MKKLVLIALSAVFMLTACTKESSSDVNQDKIYTAYELFYNSNTDVTTVVARFKFGGATGTNLELTDGASCEFNGDVLSYNDIWVGHTKDYPGMVTSGTFTYEDVDGSTFVNSTPDMDIAGHDTELDTLFKSQANVLTWSGNALAANEQINVFVGSWGWGEDALVFQNQLGATDIVIPITSLANLAVGEATMHLERVNNGTLSQGTSKGGTIKTRYKATNENVIVVP